MEQRQFIRKKCKRYNIPGYAHGLTFSCYRNIIKENTLMHAVQYIHNNPVRKALVDEPGKWYYSSYNCWFKGVDEPIRIDKETWPLF